MLYPNRAIWEVCALHHVCILAGISALCNAWGADEYSVMLWFGIWRRRASAWSSVLALFYNLGWVNFSLSQTIVNGMHVSFLSHRGSLVNTELGWKAMGAVCLQSGPHLPVLPNDLFPRRFGKILADVQEHMLNETGRAAQFTCQELCFCTLGGTQHLAVERWALPKPVCLLKQSWWSHHHHLHTCWIR